VEHVIHFYVNFNVLKQIYFTLLGPIKDWIRFLILLPVVPPAFPLEISLPEMNMCFSFPSQCPSLPHLFIHYKKAGESDNEILSYWNYVAYGVAICTLKCVSASKFTYKVEILFPKTAYNHVSVTRLRMSKCGHKDTTFLECETLTLCK
jgi:hypothetical protein